MSKSNKNTTPATPPQFKKAFFIKPVGNNMYILCQVTQEENGTVTIKQLGNEDLLSYILANASREIQQGSI